ncbi:MAG: hypothetical protein SFU83_17485 [Meiothermus sp.]|nr:hypothetical protein [Meiothermus sp.]
MKTSFYPSEDWLLRMRSAPQHFWPERERLLEALELNGLPEPEADSALRWLEESRHLQRLGEGWVLSRHPVDLDQLLHDLDEEYPELAGQHGVESRDEAARFIADKLRLDREVAREVLADLEAAGLAGLGYDPALDRERFWFRRL